MHARDHLPLREPNYKGPKGPSLVVREVPLCPPPCECADCEEHYYTTKEQSIDRFCYVKKISEIEAQRIVREYTQSLHCDREYLQRSCASHGDTIVNRWKKKSREKRQDCLLQADPTLYQDQWFIPRLTYEDPHWKEARKYRNAFLLPYLNVEVLKMNPAVLFGLLYNRTHYSPQDWAPYDSNQLIFSWAYGAFDLEYSGSCVVMHGLKYGELAKWESRPVHRWDIVGFPRARLILEAQAHLMKFLRSIVEQILEGIDLDTSGSSNKWKEMTSLGFKQTGEVEFWSTYTNQPFSAPPIFSVDNLLSTAQMRLDAIGDHLWLLQTEPAYIRRYIRVLTQGEFFNAVQTQDKYTMIMGELSHDVLTYWWWQWVQDECRNVKKQYVPFRDNINLGERLPPKYDQALGALELLLVNLMHARSRHLQAVIPQRPGFRHLWSIKQTIPGQVTCTRKSKTPVTEMFYKDPLDWCLLQLQGAPDAPRRFDHAMLFAFLDEHLSKSPSPERARLDQIIYDKLSDYATNHEMLLAVRLHRPQNANREIKEVVKSEDGKVWKRIGRLMNIPNNDRVALGVLLKDFYEAQLPSGRKDHNWLQSSDRVRKALETFWARMRECWQKALEKVLSAEDVQADLEVLSANIRPEYLRAVQAEREGILASTVRTPVAATEPLQTQWGLDKIVQSLDIKDKSKVKTRPQQPAASDEPVNHPVAIPDEELSKIPITKRALEVFTLMFPTSSEEAAKSVDWNAFVTAMSDVGFSARNGGGSAVVFDNEDSAKEGENSKIVFHKPHPIPKIDPVMLHSMGKRMSKWFGWHRDLFILES
jgi:hypothetical protein